MSIVIHISNTDIEFDSRIRKELEALASNTSRKIFAIGVAGNNAAGRKILNGTDLYTLSLLSRRLRFLPRAVRYFFELIEFTVRATRLARVIVSASPSAVSVAHCHDTFALPSGFFLKTLSGSALVYDAHELESNKNGQNKILSVATLWIEKFCWHKVDLLVSVSESIIDWYMNNLSKKPNVLVLNSPMVAAEDIKRATHTEKRYFHDKFCIPSDHKIFVYLGILAPGRGIELCLEAFKRTRGRVCIVFIGFGPLESMIRDHASRSSKIFFHPAVPHDRVVGLVSNADFGICLIENVSLSDYLCLPNKLFEYSFAGLPILASDFPEIRRAVDKYSLGVCCKPTVAALSQKLAELDYFQPSYTIESIDELSWPVQADRLRAAYSALLKH